MIDQIQSQEIPNNETIEMGGGEFGGGGSGGDF